MHRDQFPHILFGTRVDLRHAAQHISSLRTLIEYRQYLTLIVASLRR